MGISRDYKLTYKPVTEFLASISVKEQSILKKARTDIKRRGKGVKAGLQLRACLPDLEERLMDLCLHLYPTESKERYKLYKHVGKVIWAVSEVKKCSYCGGKFFGGPAYCTRSCGTSVVCNSPAWIEAHSGDKNVMRTSKGLASYKKAILKKYGVDNLKKSAQVQAKCRLNSLKKYGVPHPTQAEEVKARIQASLMSKHGVTNNMQRPEVIAACARTWKRNYEFGHALRDPAIFRRVLMAGYKRHPVTILGKTLQVQGYEPQVLKEMEPFISRITVDPAKMPALFYIGPKGVQRRYYPDALLQLKSGLNILLEVKSHYTLTKPGVLEKAKAAFAVARRFSNLHYMVALHHPKEGTTLIKNLQQFNRVLTEAEIASF